MRAIYIAILMTLFTLLLDPAFGSESDRDAKPGLMKRCATFLTNLPVRTRSRVNRYRFGDDQYRSIHNREVLAYLREQQTSPRGMSTAMHLKFVNYSPLIAAFSRQFRKKYPKAAPHSFILATSPVFLHDTSGERHPGYYDAGTLLVMRDEDALVGMALRTEMLDHAFNMGRDPGATGWLLGNAMRAVDENPDEESPKLRVPRVF